jgi:hypothetical protein
MNTEHSQDSANLDADQRKKAREALNRAFRGLSQRGNPPPPPPPQQATPEAEEAKGQERTHADGEADPKEAEAKRTKKFAVLLDKRPEELSSDFPPVLIEGLLYVGRRAMITGKPIMGKGLFLLQMGFCIATGTPFLGKRVGEPRKVYHIDFELMEASLKDRLWKMAEYFSKGDHTERDRLWALVNQNMVLCVTLDHPELNDAPEFFAEITARSISKHKPVAIFLDPLWQICPSELDERRLKEFLKELRTFTRRTGASPLYAQHQTKGEQLQKDVIDRFSGKNDLVRDCATLITLAERDRLGHVQVEIRTNDFAEPEPFIVMRKYPVFELNYDLTPINVDPATGRAPKASLDDILGLIPRHPESEGAFQGPNPPRPISRDDFIVTAKTKLNGLGRDTALSLLRVLIEHGKVMEVLLPSEKKGQSPKGYQRSKLS